MISKLSQVQLKTESIESKLKQMRTSVYNLSIFIIIIMVSIIRIAFHLGFYLKNIKKIHSFDSLNTKWSNTNWSDHFVFGYFDHFVFGPTRQNRKKKSV